MAPPAPPRKVGERWGMTYQAGGQAGKRPPGFTCDSVCLSGGPCRIRTCGLRIRSPTLYPTELRALNWLAEREGFEPSIQLWTVYWFSKPAPSASRPPLLKLIANRSLGDRPAGTSLLDRAAGAVKV